MIFAARRYGANEVYYYKEGNEYTSRTGGWVSVIGRNTPQFFKNGDNLEIRCQEGGGDTDIGYFYTDNSVDLTNIDTLVFEIEGVIASSSDRVKIGAHTSKTNVTTPTFTAMTAISGGSFSRQTYNVDVSGLTGSYYIAFYLLNSSFSASPNEVWSKMYSVYGVKAA